MQLLLKESDRKWDLLYFLMIIYTRMTHITRIFLGRILNSNDMTHITPIFLSRIQNSNDMYIYNSMIRCG